MVAVGIFAGSVAGGNAPFKTENGTAPALVTREVKLLDKRPIFGAFSTAKQGA
jgi:hypothetical protein